MRSAGRRAAVRGVPTVAGVLFGVAAVLLGVAAVIGARGYADSVSAD